MEERTGGICSCLWIQQIVVLPAAAAHYSATGAVIIAARPDPPAAPEDPPASQSLSLTPTRCHVERAFFHAAVRYLYLDKTSKHCFGLARVVAVAMGSPVGSQASLPSWTSGSDAGTGCSAGPPAPTRPDPTCPSTPVH